MVAEHEGMRLWPRFSHVRLPHVGSHAGADQAKGAEAPICGIRKDGGIRATTAAILVRGSDLLRGEWGTP